MSLNSIGSDIPVEVAKGGTGLSTVTDKEILYASATDTIGQITAAANSTLVTDGSSTPTLSQTLPSAVQGNITSVGTISSGTWEGTTVAVAQGGTSNTTFTANAVLCAGTTATGAFQDVGGVGTAGQVLVSSGAGVPTWSDSTGINGWIEVSTATETADVNTGYISTYAGTCVITLPAVSAVGDIIEFQGNDEFTSLKIAQNAGNQIFYLGTSGSPVNTTAGVGGFIQTENYNYPSFQLLCTSTSANWVVRNLNGDLSFT